MKLEYMQEEETWITKNSLYRNTKNGLEKLK